MSSAECRLRPAMCFIVPSSPTSGHRTLKPRGLNHWEHATWIDQFLAVEPGPITDDGLKFDMALVVGAQMMRGESFRQEQLALLEYAAQQDPIEHSKHAARIWLGMTGQLIDDETVALTAAQMREKDRQSLISQDSKAQAIQLMMQNWTSAVMPLVARNWAIYRADTPLLTSDNPVVIVGGPSADRRIKPGYVPALVWVYPIDRYRLLTCFRPDIQPRFPFPT